MIIAINPDEKIRYIPKCDRELPAERQTAFLLRPMKAKDAAKMQDGAAEIDLARDQKDSTLRLRSGTQELEVLRLGLAGWENFKDANGAEVEYRENNGNPRPEVLDRIPAKIRRELAEAIIEGGTLSESAGKN